MKKVVLIILVLTMVLILVLGSASAINAANPAQAKSVKISKVDQINSTFEISYSWEKYGAWSYSVSIERVDGVGNFEVVYDEPSDLGKRTDSFSFGPKEVPAKPGITLDPAQSFFIFLKLFKKNGDLETLDVTSW